MARAMMTKSFDLLTMHSCCPQILQFPTMAEGRARAYGRRFGIENRYQNERPEKEIGIKAFNTQSAGVAELRKKIETRVTATTRTATAKSGNKDDLIAEVQKFARYEEFAARIPNMTKSLKKEIIVDQLHGLRLEVFEAIPTAKKDLLEEALKDLPTTETTREQREMILARPYLSLPDSVRELDQFKQSFVGPERLLVMLETNY